MAKHFVPSIAKRKEYGIPDNAVFEAPFDIASKVKCWVFRWKPKPTDTNSSYMVSLEKKVDPNLFHEKINKVFPDTMVKVDNPKIPQSFFIILLPEPLTLKEIVYKTQKALEELL